MILNRATRLLEKAKETNRTPEYYLMSRETILDLRNELWILGSGGGQAHYLKGNQLYQEGRGKYTLNGIPIIQCDAFDNGDIYLQLDREGCLRDEL
jgi:hypothetical protein